MTTPYEQVSEFHRVFDPKENETPTAFTSEAGMYRAGFKVEELVEFLYATSEGTEDFEDSITHLEKTIQATKEKVKKQEKVKEPLVDQVDALIDLLYFTYGSFVLLNVDPTEIFTTVHEANMKKVFPDGQPHYHPETGKLLKPENWEKEYAPEGKIKEILEQIKKKPN